jgi:hypothetical protein
MFHTLLTAEGSDSDRTEDIVPSSLNGDDEDYAQCCVYLHGSRSLSVYPVKYIFTT